MFSSHQLLEYVWIHISIYNQIFMVLMDTHAKLCISDPLYDEANYEQYGAMLSAVNI